MKKIILLFFLTILAVYLLTLAPGVLHWDMAEFQYLLGTTEAGHDIGFPFYRSISNLALLVPFFNRAAKLSFLSAVFGAGVAVLTFALTYQVTRRYTSSFVGATLAALSHSLWSVAVVAEIYTFYGFLLISTVFLLVWLSTQAEIAINKTNKKQNQGTWLYLFFILYGLLFVTYPFTLLYLPVLGGYLIWQFPDSRKPPFWIVGIALFTLAAILGSTSLYFWGQGSIASNFTHGVETTVRLGQGFVKQIWRQLTGNVGGGVMELVKFLIRALSLYVYSVGVAGLLGLWGGWLLWKTKRRALLFLFVGLIGINLGSVILPRIPETYQMFPPAIVGMMVLAGIGFSDLQERLKNTAIISLMAVLILLPLVTYDLTVKVLDHFEMHVTTNRSNQYQFYPPKDEFYYPAEFSKSTSENLPEDSVIFANWYYFYNLLYGKDFIAKRDDIEVIIDIGPNSHRIKENAESKPIFIAQPGVTLPSGLYKIPFGYVYRIRQVLPIGITDEQTISLNPGKWVDLQDLEYQNKLPVQEVEQGQMLPVTHFWRVKKTLPNDYQVGVKFVRNGSAFGEEKPGVGMSGKYKYWRKLGYDYLGAKSLTPGKVIREEFNVVIPFGLPLGEYEVQIMYRKSGRVVSAKVGTISVKKGELE